MALCWAADRSLQWRSTQRTAMLPETICCDGPAATTPPGTGPIAIANADRAVSVVTLPSGLIWRSTDCQAVRTFGAGEAEGGALGPCDEHAASDATASMAAIRMRKVREYLRRTLMPSSSARWSDRRHRH